MRGNVSVEEHEYLECARVLPVRDFLYRDVLVSVAAQGDGRARLSPGGALSSDERRRLQVTLRVQERACLERASLPRPFAQVGIRPRAQVELPDGRAGRRTCAGRSCPMSAPSAGEICESGGTLWLPAPDERPCKRQSLQKQVAARRECGPGQTAVQPPSSRSSTMPGLLSACVTGIAIPLSASALRRAWKAASWRIAHL